MHSTSSKTRKADLQKIRDDLKKTRAVLEGELAGKSDANSTGEIIRKLRELRDRSEETNSMIEAIERRKRPG